MARAKRACDVCRIRTARYGVVTDFNSAAYGACSYRPTIYDTVEAIRKNLLRPDNLCPMCLYVWHTEVRPKGGWSAIVLEVYR